MFEKGKTGTAVTLAIAAVAVAAPSAGARVADFKPPAAVAASHATPPSRHAATRIVEVRPSGFAWGDAALGAAGMLSVLGAGAGAVVIARRGRPTLG